MKKPYIESLIEKLSQQYKSDLLENGWDLQNADFASLAFKDGFKEASEEFAVPEMLDALIKAQQFIENGIELGYIRMPDKETGDSATQTPKKIEQALKKAGVEL